MAQKKLAVLIVGAECSPFAKTGGLADVVGTLPKQLIALGQDARVVLPYHRVIKEKYAEVVEHICSFSVELGWRSQYVGLEKLVYNGVTYYLIDNEYYFNDRIYCGGLREGEQYAFFTRAVLEAIPMMGFSPQIIHVNDWHTAMIPMLIKTQYAGRPQEKLKTLLTIHNIAYQGKFSFGFVADLLGVEEKYDTPEFLENYGCANFLKAGLVFADKISTVSPSYAREIRYEYYAEGLGGILNARAHETVGIVNGIDCEVFDPASDSLIPYNYSAVDMSGKSKDREAMISELSIKAGKDTQLIVMISRLTAQKGLDLIIPMIDDILSEDVALVFLGTGDKEYEDRLREAEAKNGGRVRSCIMYDEELSHRLYAAADFYLMPSRFEPCGISQMIAMRYGALPIVRETGGLRDTVTAYNEWTGEGTGFSFANYNAHEMVWTVKKALYACRDGETKRKLIAQAMERDFSFAASAKKYVRLYESLV